MKSKLLDIDPQHIAQWLMRLPFAQPEHAAKLLIDALLVLRETEMRPELRQQLVGQYNEAVSQLTVVAEKNLAQKEITSSSEAQALASLVLGVLSASYLNWKICFDEQVTERSWFKRSQPKIELLDHTLLSALDALVWAKQYYLSLPRGFWLDCHSLFRFAEARSWAKSGTSGKGDSRHIYQQLLLLGLTDTNRLTEDNIRWLRLTLGDLAIHVNLHPLSEAQEHRGVYLCDPGADFPPRFINLLPKKEETWFWVDLDAVIADLNARLAEFAPEGGNGHVRKDTLELMQKLVQDWNQPQRRRHARTSANSELTVIGQMASIWFNLNGNRWQPLGMLESLSSAVRRAPVPPGKMAVVNQSPIGLMLRGNVPGHSLRTGDILLAHQGDHDIGLFFVRWITLQVENPEMECGIERIAVEAHPAEAMPSITHSGDTFQFALLLPGDPKLGVSERLLMAGRPFARLKEFRLRDEHGERMVRLTRVVNQSPYYQVMEFRSSDDF